MEQKIDFLWVDASHEYGDVKKRFYGLVKISQKRWCNRLSRRKQKRSFTRLEVGLARTDTIS